MIVLDASAVVEVVLASARGRRVSERLAPRRSSLHAPHLIDVEVVHAVRRFAASGVIDESRGRAALIALEDFGLERYGHSDLLPRMWALRHNLTAYDAAYVALAEALDAPLLTCDAPLAQTSGHGARIELVR
jgi:predicted nucleic acid-binding protein